MNGTCSYLDLLNSLSAIKQNFKLLLSYIFSFSHVGLNFSAFHVGFCSENETVYNLNDLFDRWGTVR